MRCLRAFIICSLVAMAARTESAGSVAAGFEPVRMAFEQNFAAGREIGAALHVTVDGEPVVDLWAGSADPAGTRSWEADTLVNVWSTTKGWLALAMHVLADRGLLDFDAPVARYWPRFAQNGKAGVLVRHVLTHSSGIPAPSIKVPDEALYDWEAMTNALERSELFWEPGTLCGYHAATFGWLCGEVLRRIVDQSVGAFLRSEIAGPIGADVWIGLPQTEQERVASLASLAVSDGVSDRAGASEAPRAPTELERRVRTLVATNPPRTIQAANTRRWREAEIPSSNGHASARGLARIYTVLAMGGRVGDRRVLSGAGVARAGRQQIDAEDIVGGARTRRTLGFTLPGPGDPRPATAFGHGGMGGSLGFADPASRLAFGYVMNGMASGPDPRSQSLCHAVYACLEALARRQSSTGRG